MNEANQQAESSNLSGAGIAGAALGSYNKAVSVPTWDDSTPEQRMEMMREEVRYLRRMVTDLKRDARKLKGHMHATDGRLMAPLNDPSDEDRPRGYFYDPLK